MRRASVKDREAFTLIEIVVALMIIGLALAIAGPSIVLRPPSHDEMIQELLTSARRTAGRRGETLSLELTRAGAWNLRALSAEKPLAAGHIESRSDESFHVLVSPLGSCVPQEDTASSPTSLDPLDCALRSNSSPR